MPAVGTGSSRHAANHPVWLLRKAAVGVWPIQTMDAAVYGLPLRAGDAILLLSPRNAKCQSTHALERARAD